MSRRPQRPPRPQRPRRPAEAPPAPVGHVVYGRNPVHEVVRAGRRRVKRVWAVEGAARESWLRGLKVDVVSPDDVAARAGSDAHQGIVAAVEPYPYADATTLLRTDRPFLVALDEVQDPQNLGAIARTAECAGADGLVIPERRSAEVTAAAAKASAGAVEHLAIARVRNLADFLVEARETGCWSYGAAGRASTRYDQPDYEGGVILVLGSEGRGLRPRVAKACDQLVSLPLRGRVDSLNVSAAAAILMYEIAQSRQFA